MRMPTLARSLMVGVMVALSLGTAGCSASYWTDAFSFSTVKGDVASPGKLDWTVTKDAVTQEITETKSVISQPSITLTLEANSTSVSYTTAQADFFYTEGTVNDANKAATNPIADIPAQYFPFAAQLKSGDRASGATTQTVALNGLIPVALADITDPKGQSPQRLNAVVAKVTLKGTNGFGATVTTVVNVPVTITYN